MVGWIGNWVSRLARVLSRSGSHGEHEGYGGGDWDGGDGWVALGRDLGIYSIFGYL